jgi:serine/threonine protein phosphatase PrpC
MMNNLRLHYRVYAAAVFFFGMAVLGAWTRATFGDHVAVLPSTTDVFVWLAMLACAAVSPIPLPRRGGSASLTPAFELAAIFVFGPGFACWLAVGSRIVANLVDTWDARSTIAIGQAALATGASGVVYVALDGQQGPAFLSVGGSPVALLAAAVVHIVVRHAVALGSGVLGAPDMAADRGVNTRDNFRMEAVFLPFAVPFALAQLHAGVVVAPLFAGLLILARHSRMLWEHSKCKHRDTIAVLMNALDAADPFTRGRSLRVAKMSVCVGREMHITNDELEELEYAALLHDIGRIAIRGDIAVKAGNLTNDEETILQTHPRLGAEIIEHAGLLPGAARIVAAHHEQPDGRGYPNRLSGSEVPLGSRIIMVAAAFDAMTSDRPYRSGMEPAAALDELLSNAGSQFFADVVEVFIDLYARGALFDDLDALTLAPYLRGQGSSRAVEDQLRRRGALGSSPAAPTAVADAGLVDNDVEARGTREFTFDGAAFRVRVAGATDTGCVRADNEDSFEICRGTEAADGCLFVVADGVGGAACGEVASHTAVQAVRDAFLGAPHTANPVETLRTAIEAAHAAVQAHAQSEPAAAGMATTCVAAAVRGGELVVAHAGDSRAYLIANGAIERLTQDHNLAEEMLVIAGMEAGSNARHILTRCLGQQGPLEVQAAAPILVEHGTQILLCSDGLPAVVEESEILDLVLGTTPAEACTALIRLACQRGAPDNVTVIVARLETL